MTRHSATLTADPMSHHTYVASENMPQYMASEMNAAYARQSLHGAPKDHPHAGTVDVDFLTCGNCQREFLLSEIVTFMKHKKLDCMDNSSYTNATADLYQRLMCQIKNCQQKFSTAWALLQHVQSSHALNIFLAMSLYGQGIEQIQVQHEVAAQTKSVERSQTAVDSIEVNSLCMLGLDDSFPDVQMRENSHQSVETQTDVNDKENDTESECIESMCSPEICAIRKCCDTQNCCITIMPGTHERPKKCCSSVVPKKRKQHMEQQHISSKPGAVTRSRRRKSGEKTRSSDTIYIDFGTPNSPSIAQNPNTEGQFVAQNSYVQVEGTNMYVRNGQDMVVTLDEDNGPVGMNYDGQDFSLPESFQTLLMQDSMIDMNEAGEIGRHRGMDGKKKRYPTSRPFKCDHCGMSFNQRIHLKKHLSKHTGIKPFKCGQCDYSTVERSHLKVHIRIHTGEKPFKCSFCEYATAQNSTLKIHLKRHHSGMTLTCTVCGEKFSQPKHLDKHTEGHGGGGEQQQDSGNPPNGNCMANE